LNSGLKYFALFFVIILAGCTEAPPPPTCRIAKAFNADYIGPAGCLIRVQNSLLVIKYESSQLYDLPFGDPISKESAQCTAHRNTWEKTGFNVEVDQLLGVTKSGMMLFSCSLNSGFTSEDGPIIPPNWVNKDIQYIDFINPFDTRHDLWKHSDNLIMYRDGFVKTNDSKKAQVPAQ
jgi:hypothetical protein